MVIADFPPVLTDCSNSASAGAARLFGIPACPVSDTGTALPNHPRYQLRYTRLFYAKTLARVLYNIFRLRARAKNSREVIVSLLFLLKPYAIASYACSAAFFLTTLRITNSVPMVIAIPIARQITALRMKPARMKFTKQIAATVSA